MYVYIQSEFYGRDGCDLFTVGFYDPAGNWIAESDHPTREEAAARVAYLNGKNAPLPVGIQEAFNSGDGVYRP